ncbi:hypothetical protein, partial [Staphylococcus aureus]
KKQKKKKYIQKFQLLYFKRIKSQ